MDIAIADKMVELGHVEGISHETVRQTLKPTFSRLFKTKNNIGEKKSQETAKSNSVYQ